MWKEDFQTPSTRQKNALTLKSSNKIMQLMFTKSTWLKHSKIKAFTFSRFLFFVKFFVFMLMTFYDTNTQWFIFLLLYQCKIPIFSNISYLKTFPFVKGIIRQGKFSEDIAIICTIANNLITLTVLKGYVSIVNLLEEKLQKSLNICKNMGLTF